LDAGGVEVGEADAFGGEAVEVGGFVGGVAVAGEVAVTEVVAEDQDKVGFLWRCGFVLRRRGVREEEEEGEEEERMPEWQVGLFCRIREGRGGVKMGEGIFEFCGDVAFCRILSHLREGALGVAM
jgi:hypothetical protein